MEGGDQEHLFHELEKRYLALRRENDAIVADRDLIKSSVVSMQAHLDKARGELEDALKITANKNAENTLVSLCVHVEHCRT